VEEKEEAGGRRKTRASARGVVYNTPPKKEKTPSGKYSMACCIK